MSNDRAAIAEVFGELYRMRERVGLSEQLRAAALVDRDRAIERLQLLEGARATQDAKLIAMTRLLRELVEYAPNCTEATVCYCLCRWCRARRMLEECKTT